MTATATLQALSLDLAAAAGLAHKSDIAVVVQHLGLGSASSVPVGDDCAAIPDAGEFLLLAAEGFMEALVTRDPWFAGYCGVMVNLSDVAAMGGRALGVVDILWAENGADAVPILEGLRAGSATYGVPIVGGHSNLRSSSNGFGAAVLGRAKSLISSYDARPGDHLIFAVDLRGRFREPDAYWDASTGRPPERLRADLELLPKIAELGLVRAGKDISMAGFVGTALMLLECSGVGAWLDLAAIPIPPETALARWLKTFPSFGFVLAVSPLKVDEVLGLFEDRGIAASDVGEVTVVTDVRLRLGDEETLFWSLSQRKLIGCGPDSEIANAS